MSPLEMKDNPLGRGLKNLFGHDSSSPPDEFRWVPLENIQPGKYQPRRFFDPKALREMVDSINLQGILQPILIRPLNEEQTLFEIVAGERRWKAAKEAGLTEIPAWVRVITDHQALEMAIVENIQRQDLNLIEEGQAYKRLVDEFDYTHEAIAQGVKKSRSYITNAIRLLNLPEKIQEAVRKNLITASHARTLINMENPEEVAAEIQKNHINVRETETLKQKGKTVPQGAEVANENNNQNLELAIIAELLRRKLQMPVTITHARGKGELKIKFTTVAQLDHLLKQLSQKIDVHSPPTSQTEVPSLPTSPGDVSRET